MHYKLSICIPTYNRATYLDATLGSIIDQIVDGVEIVVCDNCSTDNTELKLRDYTTRYDFIRYIKHASNLGADLNYLSCVQNASGEYVVIFGSDDILMENSINDLLYYIDLYHYDYYIFDRDYGEDVRNSILQKPFCYQRNTLMRLNGSNHGYIDYFMHTNSLLGGFAFIGNVVFKKSLWDGIELKQIYVGSFYLHVYYHFMVFSKKIPIDIYYVNQSFVFARGGNDSFYQNMAQRMLVDYEGYFQLAQLFPDRTIQTSILQMVVRPYPIYTSKFLFICLLENSAYRSKVLKFARIYGYKYLWIISILTSKLFHGFSYICYKAYVRLKCIIRKVIGDA